MPQKTVSLRKEDARSGRKWYVANAADQVLGRLASRVATILRGKHKPTFTPHVDGGDHVIVVNAEKIRVTGKKKSELSALNFFQDLEEIRDAQKCFSNSRLHIQTGQHTTHN